MPDADDVYNFVGASRDGLNVNDSNGLDGPLNDDFTYVANDRPRQGQTFFTPDAQVPFRLQAIWLKMAGYTDNGAAPETGFDGTDANFSPGGAFYFRGTIPGPLGGIGSFFNSDSYELTGTEPGNPAPNGLTTSASGASFWLRLTFEFTPTIGPNRLYGFDVASTALNNAQFEWLGTNSDAYAGGGAYNGNQVGLGSNRVETALNPLAGDRVFLVQLVLAPEPGALSLGAMMGLAVLAMGRAARRA